MKTITSSEEISSLFHSGKRVQSPSITFIVSTQHDRTLSMVGRVAFIAGKKSGNAVWRNAAKRRMREIYRACVTGECGFDIIMLAKKNIVDRPYQAVLQESKAAFSQIEGIKEGD